VLIIITQKQLSVLAIDQIVMVGSPRIMRTLAAIFAVQLLQTASAEVAEEVCAPTSVKGAGDYEECVPSPKRGAELIQTAKRASLAGQGQSDAKQNQSDLGRGEVSYCWEVDRWATNGQQACWKEKPSSDSPECTPDSGETPCRCKTAECRFDLLSSSPPTTATCAKKALYFLGGTYSSDSPSRSSVSQVLGTGMEMYCTEMVKITDWNARHIIKRPNDISERSDSPEWNCWWNYMWKTGENGCFRKTRYLGEKCWDYGDCAGTEEGLTSCVDGTCIPAGFKPREPCECSWGTQSDALLCYSPGRSCRGYACTMSLEGNSRYCDFDKTWYS